MPNPVCPTTCAANLPPVEFDDCNPEFVASEIIKIYVAKMTAAPFADVTDLAEWTPRVSETSIADDDVIRPLTVIADKPAPTSTVTDRSNGRRSRGIKLHTINITVDEATQINYEFLRALECNGQYRIWYETAGGYMYGGNEGIPRVAFNLDDLLNRGIEEIETYGGTAEWRSKFHPERTISPFGPLYVPPVP